MNIWTRARNRLNENHPIIRAQFLENGVIRASFKRNAAESESDFGRRVNVKYCELLDRENKSIEDINLCFERI